MRQIRFCVLMGLLAWLLVPGEGTSQSPFGGKSSGGSKGMFGDPSKLFDMMSGGKDVASRDTLPNPFLAKMFDRFAQQIGVTNGTITREQFNAYMQQQMGDKGSGGTAVTLGKPGIGPSNGKSTSGGTVLSQDIIDQWAENQFRRWDTNGDGLLNYDEMPENLRAERDKYDTNKDGFIDLNEFKVWFRARIEQRMVERAMQSEGTGGGGDPEPDHPEREEAKPVVYRAGKLPKELPSWFAEIDKDGDGQISLYEWRTAGRSIEDFQKMDRNGDGFLTIAEVLYYTQGKNYLNGVSMVAAADTKTKGIGQATITAKGNGKGVTLPAAGDGKGFDKGSWSGSRDGKTSRTSGSPSADSKSSDAKSIRSSSFGRGKQ